MPECPLKEPKQEGEKTMIKIFTTNKDGKIELTKDELKSLLDDAYWEGYRAHTTTTYMYSTPNWTPYKWTISTTCGNASEQEHSVTLCTSGQEYSATSVNTELTKDELKRILT